MFGSLETIEDIGRAAVLLHPLRLRIVGELREPDSASGLSRKLALPRQKLNYHLRELERQGFLELVEERRKGNCIERVVRATARTFVIDPRALGDLAADPEQIEDRFSSSYLVALAAKVIRDVALLRKEAEVAQKKLPTLSLQSEVRFATSEKQHAFAEELTRELSRLVAKYHEEAPEGRSFELFAGSYPKITKGSKP